MGFSKGVAVSGEKGLLTQRWRLWVFLHVTWVGRLGSEALRWRAWLLRMGFDNVVGGCPNEGKVYRSLGLEWEGGSFCGSPGGIGVEKRGLEI